MSRPLPHDDRALLVAARSSPEAFAVFYDRNAAGLIRHFRRRGLTPELALDLCAETFAAALESVERYEPGPPPATAWLYGIAHHVMAQSARRGRIENGARLRMHVARLTVTDAGLERVEELASIDDDALGRSLDALPPEQRDAVLARIVDERDYTDIAAQLACSEHLVRQRVSRGLGRLRNALQGGRT